MIRNIALLLLLGFMHPTIAQKSYRYDSDENEYEKAVELYELGKYGLARIQFKNYVDAHGKEVSARVTEAAYMQRVCAQKLSNEDAQYLWEEYIQNYPSSNRLPYANMNIGDIYSAKNKYRQASRWYEKVNANGLDKVTKVDYHFAAGYSLFMQKKYDEALIQFNHLKGKDNKYNSSVLYYYSHIQYEKANYQTALDGFTKLENDKGFKKVVPFYIAQIYYLQKAYDNAIKYALPLVKDGTKERQADMNRIVADSYYGKKEYKQSIVYYEKAIELSSEPRREDFYHLGFAYYFISNFEKATEGLSQVTSAEDIMAQNAYYHLGDCYLKLNDKKRARVAFEAASKYEFDKDIQEDALFNYIKLNYELSFSPFNEIINSFMTYIELFPESDKIDQAYEYLGKAFLTTKNYREALASMEKIQRKTGDVYRAMQRVAYYRGLELFTDLNFVEAIEFFNYSLKYAEYDKDLKVGAYYWRGESYYRTGDYQKAIVDFREFIYMPGSYKMEEFAVAHYNIAYAYFKQKEYGESQGWFRKYVNLSEGKDRVLYGDALNRTGDCYYVNREFDAAINYYNRGASVPEGSPDYALFQKGFCHGLEKDYNNKITVLKSLLTRYPKSPYVDDALYELGRSYVATNNLKEAIYNYKLIKEKYPKGSYSKKAMLQLGLVYYNTNELDNSLAFYKRVVNEYPGTQEAENALLGIRNIYLDRNNLDGYVRYTEQVGGFARLDNREQDSLTFVAAERFYMKNDCEHAVKHFKSYLATYPDGKFVLNAHFYKADCQYRNTEYTDALASYEYVANRERSLFTEEALIRMGELHFQQGAYRQAYNAFVRLEQEAEIAENRLEAKIGVMRSLTKMNQPEECISAASKLLNAPKIADEIKREAIYNTALSYRELGNSEKALEFFAQIASNTKSVEGAEAKYYIAQYKYDLNDVEASEKEVFDYIDKGTPHQYWLARSFILLAQIYQDRGESFQAIQYLESINENYTGDDDISSRVHALMKEWKKVPEMKEHADTVNVANN
ncbi:tetratricopeptide repeat protein [Carboxylicivirga sp. N1Y90]|uniref:tetratricopeptide repeat protein n=1 Tax=Carboxylicivirga fragile TaxID=3417571 RepID=UPI003D32FAEA|nr:tetratricopeptide repeat protein [Marinilabiliaceae bacterium N1Y90]